MSWMDGIMQAREDADQLALNKLVLGSQALSLAQQIKQAKAEKATQSLWDQFDPQHPADSLAVIAAGQGKAGDPQGAVKTLGAAATYSQKEMQMQNYASMIEKRRSDEIISELKERLSEKKQAEQMEYQYAKEDRLASQFNASQERMYAHMAQAQANADRNARLAEARIGMEGKKIDMQISHWDRIEASKKDDEARKATSDRLKQEGMLRKSQEALIPKKPADDVLNTLKSHPDFGEVDQDSLPGLASIVANRAKTKLAQHSSKIKDPDSWEPMDWGEAVQQTLDEMKKNNEYKFQKHGGFLGMGGSTKVEVNPAKRESSGKVTQGPATIKSDEDFAKLPSGAEFIGPDGVRRRKP